MYAVPISMSRERDLDETVRAALLKSKHQTLGLMQLYYYTWINVDERTSQEEKDLLIKATEKAEPYIKDQVEKTESIASYIFYKKMKRDYRVELRAVYDQKLLKSIWRKQIINRLEPNENFKGKDINELLIFEK